LDEFHEGRSVLGGWGSRGGRLSREGIEILRAPHDDNNADESAGANQEGSEPFKSASGRPDFTTTTFGARQGKKNEQQPSATGLNFDI
jgi:hypothetical protein